MAVMPWDCRRSAGKADAAGAVGTETESCQAQHRLAFIRAIRRGLQWAHSTHCYRCTYSGSTLRCRSLWWRAFRVLMKWAAPQAHWAWLIHEKYRTEAYTLNRLLGARTYRPPLVLHTLGVTWFSAMILGWPRCGYKCVRHPPHVGCVSVCVCVLKPCPHRINAHLAGLRSILTHSTI